MILDPLPPHDLAAERNALACILDSDYDNAAKTFAQLEEHHFYGEQSRQIFRALTKCEADGKPLNIVSLGEQLLADGETENLDFAQTLTVPSAAAFPSYLDILNDRAARREQVGQAQRQIQRARDMSMPFTAVADNSKLLVRLEARLYSPANQPPEPNTVLYLAGQPCGTGGNLGNIVSAAKGGKTAFVEAAVAAPMAAPNSDCLGWRSNNQPGKAIIRLDTEQTPFDHWAGTRRILRRAGVESAPPWLRSYCITGFCLREIRATIKLSLETNAQKFGGIHSMFVDGVADCVADVNDPAECGDFVAELHSLAIQYDCPIIGVIHLNPGSDFKTRGHLGSQLERKAESNIRLEKDSNGITVVWADKNRRAPIMKATGPRFKWSDELQMHVSVSTMSDVKQAADEIETRDRIDEAFRLAGKSAMTWTDTVSSLLRVPGVGSKRTAERVFTSAKCHAIIRKNIIQQWEICQ